MSVFGDDCISTHADPTHDQPLTNRPTHGPRPWDSAGQLASACGRHAGRFVQFWASGELFVCFLFARLRIPLARIKLACLVAIVAERPHDTLDLLKSINYCRCTKVIFGEACSE